MEHLGLVHQWVCGMVTSGDAPEEEPVGPGEGEDLAAWYGRHVRDLLDALASAGPEWPCGTYQPDNQRALYWFQAGAAAAAVAGSDGAAAEG